MEKKNNIIRIALIGPESTAKSTLAETLAKHYDTVWVPEYSRTYLSSINRKYNLNDIVSIAKEQWKQENELLKKATHYIFADTELIISKVWCLDVFNTCPKWILENIIPFKYDLYLVCSPDLPWQEDPLRENPHRRGFFFDWYMEEIKSIGGNYFIVKGEGEERLKNCITAIQNVKSIIFFHKN